MLLYIITIGNISRQEKANNKHIKLQNFITILKKEILMGLIRKMKAQKFLYIGEE